MSTETIIKKKGPIKTSIEGAGEGIEQDEGYISGGDTYIGGEDYIDVNPGL